MKAIAQRAYGGVDVLVHLTVPKPAPVRRELLVEVKAVSVNPVDTKLRTNYGKPPGPLPAPVILGFDASGIVEAVGPDAKLFQPGDEVFFAGVRNRNGSNAEYTVVDERIVGKKPKSFSFEQAAAVPLTGLTAWEGLEVQLGIPPYADNTAKILLAVAGAGGVGSIVIPLAKKVFNLTVIATASRPETVEFSKKMGADFVIDHSKDIAAELKAIGFNGVDYIFNAADFENFSKLAPVLNVFGKIVGITTPKQPIDVQSLFHKCATLTFEFMFARGIHELDILKQHEILDQISDLVDKGVIPDRATRVLSLTKDLATAHQALESGKTIGKIVLTVDF